jgi:hypothetical protein
MLNFAGKCMPISRSFATAQPGPGPPGWCILSRGRGSGRRSYSGVDVPCRTVMSTMFTLPLPATRVTGEAASQEYVLSVSISAGAGGPKLTNRTSRSKPRTPVTRHWLSSSATSRRIAEGSRDKASASVGNRGGKSRRELMKIGQSAPEIASDATCDRRIV